MFASGQADCLAVQEKKGAKGREILKQELKQELEQERKELERKVS